MNKHLYLGISIASALLFILFTLFLTMSLLKSYNNKKSYRYIEIVYKKNISGDSDIKEQEKTIRAISDSAAYLKAYKSFYASQKINNDIKKSSNKIYSIPLRFKLIDIKGNNIADSISFAKQDSLKENIKNSIKKLISNN